MSTAAGARSDFQSLKAARAANMVPCLCAAMLQCIGVLAALESVLVCHHTALT